MKKTAGICTLIAALVFSATLALAADTECTDKAGTWEVTVDLQHGGCKPVHFSHLESGLSERAQKRSARRCSEIECQVGTRHLSHYKLLGGA